MEKHEISVFIVEDQELAKKLVHEHFGTGITFASIVDKGERQAIVDAINEAS